MNQLKIRQVPIADLTPYQNNARTHSVDQVAAIAKSIQKFGFNNPVLVDSNNGIIAGHGRVLAAEQLGLKKVPVVELAHLTDAERRAYVIADNQLALRAGWDYDVLGAELRRLESERFDIDAIGFTPGDLERIHDEWHSDIESAHSVSPEAGLGMVTVRVHCPMHAKNDVIDCLRAALIEAGMEDVQVGE